MLPTPDLSPLYRVDVRQCARNKTFTDNEVYCTPPGPIDPTPAYVPPLTLTATPALDPHVGFCQFRHPVQSPARGAEEDHEVAGYERERRARCGHEEEQPGERVGLVGPDDPPQAENEYLRSASTIVNK